ncbi:MAG: DUF4258 domain-containing protein [Candidatus Micrarchaeota archaeon]
MAGLPLFELLENFKYYLLNIILISSYWRLFRGDYEVFVLEHAAIRAAQRKIPRELLERTLYEGKFERFGNNKVRICKNFHRGKVICIGVIEKDKIKIITVEVGR